MSAVDYKSEVRDGMRVDWDVPIPMSDGVAMRCDIFRPLAEGQYPVILTYGPYGKGLSFQEGYAAQWQKMASEHPDVTEGPTNKYQNWEAVDPEGWGPDGYACFGADSGAAGGYPGTLASGP